MKKIRCRVKRYEKRGVQRRGPDWATPKHQSRTSSRVFAWSLRAAHSRVRTAPPAHLSGKPFDTLVYLVERAGELVDRDELLHSVWPKRVIEDNNLNQAIATLRRILGEQHVVTVAGRGYQFVTPVRRVPTVSRARCARATPAPSIARTASPPTDPGPTIGRVRRRYTTMALAVARVRRIRRAASPSVARARAARTARSSPPTSLVGTRVTVQPLTTLSRRGAHAGAIARRNASRILVARSVRRVAKSTSLQIGVARAISAERRRRRPMT